MSTTLDETRDGDKARETADIETSEYAERLELLYEVAEKVSSVSEVSELLEEILSVTQRLLKASAASLFLIDPEKGELYVQAAGGPLAGALKQMRLDLDSGIVGWVANHGKPLNIGDVTSDKRFNKDLDKVTGFITKSILAVPLVRGRKVIGVLEVLNKIDGSAFDDQDSVVLTGLVSTEALVLLVSMAAVAIANIKLSQTALDGCKSTVETLVTAADARDPYAWGHSHRVRQYTLMAATAFSLPAEERRVIEFGGLLHDIGKIGINESILRKSGPLTAEEWYIVRKHPLRGANIVGQIPYLEKAKKIVLYHHERYDGTGYPEGLKGENIPFGARLVAVADAFDTMTTDHSYRAALSVDQAMDELGKGMGTQFCPAAVNAFISGFNKQNRKLSPIKAEGVSQEALSIKAQEVPQETLSVEPHEAPQETLKIEVQKMLLEKLGVEPQEVRKETLSLEAQEAPQETLNIEVQKMLLEKLGVEPQEVRKETLSLEAQEAPQETLKEVAASQEKAKKIVYDIGPETYQGEIQLVVPSPASFEQVRQFQERLQEIEDLKIILVGGSADEGALIVVSVPTPLALGQVLKEIPAVESVDRIDKKAKKKLIVTLKATADN